MPKLVRSIRSSLGNSLYQENINTNNYLFPNHRQPALLQMQYTQNDSRNIPHQKEIQDQDVYHHNPKYGASKYIASLQSGKMHKLINNTSK